MKTIRRVGLIGAGTMGSGIAISLVEKGIEAVLTDVSAEQLERARAAAASHFGRAVEKGRTTQAAADAALALLKTESGLEAVADTDLVIEAVFEDFDLKVETFKRLMPLLADDTLVATNTSCLRVSDLAAAVDKPGRFLGLHYFSPAQINPLVEVVRGEKTGDETIEAALAFVKAGGKQPLLCKDRWGFAVNRFFCPYTNEADRMLDEGLATTGQIDEVAKEALGVAAGPFLVQNLIKPRINLHAIRNLGPLGPFYAPAAGLVKLGEAEGRFEIEAEPAALPAERRAEIARRLRGAAFLPVLQSLDEGVAAPADIDMGAKQALRFGRPPCALMDELGREEVEAAIAPLCATYGVDKPASLARVGSLVQ